ncbi:unnamed protein product [Sphagnum balticum]
MLKSLHIAQFMNKKRDFVVSLSKGFPLPSIGFLFPVRRSDTLSTPRAETLSLTLQQRTGGFYIAFFAGSCAALCFGMFFFAYVEFRCYCGNDKEAGGGIPAGAIRNGNEIKVVRPREGTERHFFYVKKKR